MMLAGGTASPRCNRVILELKRNTWRQVRSSTCSMAQEKRMSAKRTIWTRAVVGSAERITTDEEISEFAKKLGLMVWSFVNLFLFRRGEKGANSHPQQSSNGPLLWASLT